MLIARETADELDGVRLGRRGGVVGEVEDRHDRAVRHVPFGSDVRHMADEQVTRADLELVALVLEVLEIRATTYQSRGH
jgi:hypothetical protein